MKPVILYDTECWSVNRKIEQKKGVRVIRILGRMSEVPRENRIRNEYVTVAAPRTGPGGPWPVLKIPGPSTGPS